MKLINKTQWDTDQLRRFYHICADYDRKQEGSSGINGVEIKVVHSRGGGVYSGYAYLPIGDRKLGHKMLLRLPRPGIKLNIKKMAFVFIHECCHLRGIPHRKIGLYEDCGAIDSKIDFSYLELWKEEFRVQEEKTDMKIDIKMMRFQKILRSLEKKKNKLSSLQKAIKKLEAKRKYYEKTMAKAAISIHKLSQPQNEGQS